MDILLNFINAFLDIILYKIITPFILFIDRLLSSVFSPALNTNHYIFIILVALLASLISLILSVVFKEKNSETMNMDLKDKISSLKYLSEIEDKTLKRAIKQGVNESADRVYENMIAEKFFNSCITYFLPMCFFLIWLEYSIIIGSKMRSYDFSLLGFSLPMYFMFILLFHLNLLAFFILKKTIVFCIYRKRTD